MHGKSLFRMIALVVAASAFALFVAGCGDDDDPTATNPGTPAGATGTEAGGAAVEAGKVQDPEAVEEQKKALGDEPPPVFLLSGERSGWDVSKPTALVARSKKQLNEIKRNLKSSDVDTSSMASTDFKTRQIIGVQFPEEEGGVLMQVLAVNEQDGKIVIKTARIVPGKGCPKGKPGNPFHVVETRAMQGEPKIEVETVKNSPC